MKWMLLVAWNFILTSSLFGLGSPSVIIDIDNPSFRQIVAAVPPFTLEGEFTPDWVNWSKEGNQEMRELLNFSGMFSVLDQAVYENMAKAPAPTGKSAIDGFDGVDTTQWKTLGVESLTIGKLVKVGIEARLELRTADLVKGVQVLGKSYMVKNKAQLSQVIKQYLDRLLQAYTGKPGIFSTKIVFVGRKAPKAEKQIFTCDIDGKNVEQITHLEKFTHLAPSWSPDGKKILYTSYEAGNPDLYMLDMVTRKKTKIAGYQGINSGAVFSPNGKLIAFTGSVVGDAEIFYTYPGVNKRFPLIGGHGIEVDPEFSPDGQWMVFVSGRYGNPHLFRAKLAWNEAMDQVRVLEDKRLTYAGWYNATPAYSKDSQKIVFAGYDKDIDRFDLFLMNHDGTNLERLTIRAGDNESPSWSPNGQLVMFHSNRMGTSDVKGQAQLFIMNKDGSNQRMIPTGLYEAQTPKWGPFLLTD